MIGGWEVGMGYEVGDGWDGVVVGGVGQCVVCVGEGMRSGGLCRVRGGVCKR